MAGPRPSCVRQADSYGSRQYSITRGQPEHRRETHVPVLHDRAHADALKPGTVEARRLHVQRIDVAVDARVGQRVRANEARERRAASRRDSEHLGRSQHCRVRALQRVVALQIVPQVARRWGRARWCVGVKL